MVLQRKRTFIIRIYLLIFLIFNASDSHGQPIKQARSDFQKLEKLLASHKISKKDYIDSVVKYSNTYLMMGVTLESKDYRNLLQPFKEICFGNDSLLSFTKTYYTILANNAQWGNRNGEAMYYYDKISKLQTKDTFKIIYSLSRKFRYYIGEGKYKTICNEYRSNVKEIDGTVQNLLYTGDSSKPNVDIFYVLNISAYALAKEKDSSNVQKILSQAETLRKSFFNKKKTPDNSKIVVAYMSKSIFLYQALMIENDFQKSMKVISDIEREIIKINPQQNEWKKMAFDLIIGLRIKAFLQIKAKDSVEYYLQKLNNSIVSEGEQSEYLERLSQLYAEDKDFQKAYEHLKKVFTIQEQLFEDNKNELDKLLYAFTEAEEIKFELLRAEKENQNRAIWILVIIFVAILIFLGLYVLIRKRDTEAKKQIALLNYQASVQITELEESKNEMQENLGRDLHDNLASLLAGIKHKIEYLNLDLENKNVKSILEDINLKVEEAYLRVRNKSHDLYEEGFQNSEQNFEKRIKQLIDFSLPDNHFEKEILVDKGAVNLLSTDEKIELLKIIQEIITNIIKHAKASKISLLIYEDQNKFNMSVKDNGRGYDVLKKAGLGINSIKSRVQKLRGDINIQSGNMGTEINITLLGNQV